MTAQTPATRNEAWGFWGTMQEQAEAAWPLAMTTIADATGEDPDAVRAFLDATHGRHFADDVRSAMYQGQPLPDAINAVAQQWMSWKISRATSVRHGIPRGLPYLTGLVIHCGTLE
jgi:hypothetical protein